MSVRASRRSVFTALALGVVLFIPISRVLADTTDVVVTGGFTTNDVGTFSAAISMKTADGCGGDLDYGAFEVDAVGAAEGLTPAQISFCIDYVDTAVSRDAFFVQVKIASFELVQIPVFEGSDVAHFQIPNRYLVLTSVGTVTGGSTGTGVGTLSADSTDLTLDFSGDTSARRIAQASSGSGVVSARQEITLTLDIPAGIYPGTYVSNLLIETVTAP